MERLCAVLGDKGCDGIFVLGSTGSWHLLDERQRRALTAAAREGAPASARLYVGISGTGPEQSVRFASCAAEDGADVVVVTAPLMCKYSQGELAQYFTRIADGSPLPLILYHHPRIPTPLEVETIAKLSGHPNIVGVKDTSMDMERFKGLVDRTAENGVAVMQGSEKLIHEGLKVGGAGCMTALAGALGPGRVECFDL